MEIFNETDALEKTADDRELLAEVIRFTLAETPAILKQTEEALAAKEYGEVSRLAHKVKGSAGACGAQAFYMKALDLELAGKEGMDSCTELFSALVSAFQEFREHPGVKELAALDPGAEASIG